MKSDKQKAMEAYHKAVNKLTGHGENNLQWMDIIRDHIKYSQTPERVTYDELNIQSH